MSPVILHNETNSIPFTLGFVEKIDNAMYEEAIKNSNEIGNSYDPISQVSSFSIYAGTTLTYDNSMSGLFPPKSVDDTNQTDT